MSEAGEQRYYAVVTTIVMLVAAIAITGMVLGYRSCQNDNERVLECIKSGQSARDCGNAIRDSRPGRSAE